ncbi:hypothetical protein NDU88_004934 [Pleurodeles waltl]|uniref:Uncharacterized protein n=1 Tax=Pleurodeles waltl TaxID=8319 RepID=A0AAV7UGL0_PLEWA|nr:hypothetical protein NDU88_004934 [Pleurodeles waltl]
MSSGSPWRVDRLLPHSPGATFRTQKLPLPLTAVPRSHDEHSGELVDKAMVPGLHHGDLRQDASGWIGAGEDADQELRCGVWCQCAAGCFGSHEATSVKLVMRGLNKLRCIVFEKATGLELVMQDLALGCIQGSCRSGACFVLVAQNRRPVD